MADDRHEDIRAGMDLDTGLKLGELVPQVRGRSTALLLARAVTTQER